MCGLCTESLTRLARVLTAHTAPQARDARPVRANTPSPLTVPTDPPGRERTAQRTAHPLTQPTAPRSAAEWLGTCVRACAALLCAPRRRHALHSSLHHPSQRHLPPETSAAPVMAPTAALRAGSAVRDLVAVGGAAPLGPAAATRRASRRTLVGRWIVGNRKDDRQFSSISCATSRSMLNATTVAATGALVRACSNNNHDNNNNSNNNDNGVGQSVMQIS